jgi:hypothetical protein
MIPGYGGCLTTLGDPFGKTPLLAYVRNAGEEKYREIYLRPRFRLLIAGDLPENYVVG